MKIEGYTLHNILQVTLMGYITRVTRREDKTDYAAKISHLDRILSNSAENPNVEQLVFERLQLHPHPHLLSTQETIVSGNKVINILPLAHGDLFDYPPDADQTYTCFGQMLAALDHLHNVVGVEHGDLTLENVLFFDEHVKICDYGQSMVMGEHRTTKQCRGKPTYTAPELYHSGQVDGKADVFSLGVVLFCMIGQCEMFGRASFDDPTYRYIQKCENVNRFDELWQEWKMPTTPTHVKWLILNMTRHNAAERMSIREIKDWVNKFGLV